ncbi:hypothetical protein GB937_008935 [Aspergillus fischeri]|nr:hypothetical protein GB937_008935 [Aspergillus fischeri]
MTDKSMTATVAVGVVTGILAIPPFLIGGKALLQRFRRWRGRTADEPILPTSSHRVDNTDAHYEAQQLHYNYPPVSKQQDGPNATPATEPTAIPAQTRATPLQQFVVIESIVTSSEVVVGTVVNSS